MALASSHDTVEAHRGTVSLFRFPRGAFLGRFSSISRSISSRRRSMTSVLVVGYTFDPPLFGPSLLTIPLKRVGLHRPKGARGGKGFLIPDRPRPGASA